MLITCVWASKSVKVLSGFRERYGISSPKISQPHLAILSPELVFLFIHLFSD